MGREIVEIPDPTEEEIWGLDVSFYHNYIRDRTVIVFGDTIASGVLIEIGNHLFVATAAHCITTTPAIIFKLGRHPFPPPKTKWLKIGRNTILDIGFIEIENNPNLQRCSVDNLSVELPALPKDPRKPEKSDFFCICGFPETIMELAPDKIPERICRGVLRTHPQVITEELYQFNYGSRFKFPKGMTLEETMQPDRPHGFSGSGLWKCNPPQPGVVVPLNIKLYGIQYEWHDNDSKSPLRVIWCAPIRQWIKYIYDAYSDLTRILEDRFEFLREQK